MPTANIPNMPISSVRFLFEKNIIIIKRDRKTENQAP
jgi:hypothetical protein